MGMTNYFVSIAYFCFISQSFHLTISHGFIFNKKYRDFTNAIITASFSPFFDKIINTFSEDTPSSVEMLQSVYLPDIDNLSNIKVSENIQVKNNIDLIPSLYFYDKKKEDNKNMFFDSPISSFINKEETKPLQNKYKTFYVLESKPSLINDGLFLKLEKKDVAFLMTGEILISIILIAILIELQKLTIFQNK
jgi:hypothetical protein